MEKTKVTFVKTNFSKRKIVLPLVGTIEVDESNSFEVDSEKVEKIIEKLKDGNLAIQKSSSPDTKKKSEVAMKTDEMKDKVKKMNKEQLVRFAEQVYKELGVNKKDIKSMTAFEIKKLIDEKL